MGYDDGNYGHDLNAAKAVGQQAAQTALGGAPAILRDRIMEATKLVDDARGTVEQAADRLFGGEILRMAGSIGDVQGLNSEPSIDQLLAKLVRNASALQQQAQRLNRIG